MTDIRMLDLNQWPLVLAIRPCGHAELIHAAMSPAAAAAELRRLAFMLDQAAAACEAPPLSPSGDYIEPMAARGGTLDGDRWTDGHGHVWDLSLIWTDECDQTWMWAGWFDRSGAPMMRSVDHGDQMPLDTVRVVYGALRPGSAGGR